MIALLERDGERGREEERSWISSAQLLQLWGVTSVDGRYLCLSLSLSLLLISLPLSLSVCCAFQMKIHASLLKKKKNGGAGKQQQQWEIYGEMSRISSEARLLDLVPEAARIITSENLALGAWKPWLLELVAVIFPQDREMGPGKPLDCTDAGLVSILLPQLKVWGSLGLFCAPLQRTEVHRHEANSGKGAVVEAEWVYVCRKGTCQARIQREWLGAPLLKSSVPRAWPRAHEDQTSPCRMYSASQKPHPRSKPAAFLSPRCMAAHTEWHLGHRNTWMGCLSLHPGRQEHQVSWRVDLPGVAFLGRAACCCLGPLTLSALITLQPSLSLLESTSHASELVPELLCNWRLHLFLFLFLFNM